jgi:hypothetical protein
METPDLVSLHLRIETAVKEIVKDGKLDKPEIPAIVLLITQLVLAPNTSVKMSEETIMEKMDQMFDYIMNHYDLYPVKDEATIAAYKELFNISVKLVLFQPNIKKICKWCCLL